MSNLRLHSSTKYAVINVERGIVFECENYHSALNLRREIHVGTIWNLQSPLGLIQVARAQKVAKTYNYETPTTNSHKP